MTPGNLSLTLTVLAQTPRVLHIPNFLNDFECDSIIEIAAPRIRLSSVGQGGNAFTSTTRTSHNTWIGRSASPVIETLYRRAAHVLNIDDSLLHPYKNAEEMQVEIFIHYMLISVVISVNFR
jgi:hypothetical protein